MRIALNYSNPLPRTFAFLARVVPPVLRWSALILFCLFVGATLAAMDILAAGVWTAMGGLLLLPLFMAQANKGVRDWTIYIYFLYICLLPIAVKLSGIAVIIGAPQVIVFMAGALGLPAFLIYCGHSRLLVFALISFSLFLAFALLSSEFGRSRSFAAAYQLFSDLKPLLMLSAGFLAVWSVSAERFVDWWAKYYWAMSLVFVAAEWAAPGAYGKLFIGSTQGGDPSGLFPSRAVGMTEHPAFLAAGASFFAIYSFGRLLGGVNRRAWLIATGGNLLVLVCAVQRQALVGAFAAMMLMLLVSNPKALLQRAIVAGLVVLLVGVPVASVYSEYVQRDIATWGITSRGSIEAPRAQIYRTGMEVAKHYFPLGSGLGTYGGAGAAKYDDSLYYEMGFNRLWWFRTQNFLMDTYWPNPIAETGYFGTACLAGFYVLILLFMIAKAFKARPEMRVYWLICAGSFLSVLQLTATHPGFNDPRLALFSALMLGLAATRERELKR